MTTVVIDPPPLYCGEHTEHHAIVAIDVCGCLGAFSVLEHHEAEAYKTAAKEAKAGMRIETWTVQAVRGIGWHCADHPQGPPWWKSNGAKVKRPTEYAAAIR